MNMDTAAHNTTRTTSRLGAKIGVVISVLVGAFLAVDAAGKLAGVSQVKEGTEALGFPADQALVMGVVLAVCVVAFAVPRTAVLGAFGITAYLGGAVTANMRVEAPLFSATLFAVYLGVLMWVGMVLRRPELLRIAGLAHRSPPRRGVSACHNPVVQIGMTLPVMEPDLDAAVLKEWARVVDDGPFSSLCWGERIAFGNPDSLTLLGALAAWTDRVRLVTTVIVPQLHDPVMLAKGLATGDMLSGGRLTVGIGVGGRQEDYDAVGADMASQTMRGMAERVAIMKRVWAGEKVTESVLPVGPSSVQPGGPR